MCFAPLPPLNNKKKPQQRVKVFLVFVLQFVVAVIATVFFSAIALAVIFESIFARCELLSLLTLIFTQLLCVLLLNTRTYIHTYIRIYKSNRIESS